MKLRFVEIKSSGMWFGGPRQGQKSG
jgi:hypothetical protein